MAIELSTAGITLKYATGSTKPSTGFTAINGIKSLSEINPEPNMLDCTPLAETEWHRYIPGLKDIGGAWSITVNDYDDFRTSWDDVLDDYAGRTSGHDMWFEINVPGLTTNSSFYFTGIPSALGFGGAEVDSVYENVAYITINKIDGWGTKSGS